MDSEFKFIGRYQGYTGYAKYDDEALLYHGEVAGIRDVVTFQGRTLDEARQAFRDSVDDYRRMVPSDTNDERVG